MKLIVQKFGGTSVGSVERIEHVANLIIQNYLKDQNIVAVVSAMSGETNRLESMVKNLSAESNRASDMVMSSGEQVSVGLLAMAIDKLAVEKELIKPGESLSWPILSFQAGVRTKSASYGCARIDAVDIDKFDQAFRERKIPVLAGYQCFDGEYVNTLGRGGSDTSAMALAKLLGAQRCDIYTDVDGVYSSDPRQCPHAKRYKVISKEEMLALSTYGAKVVHPVAVEYALECDIPMRVRSTFKPEDEGTLIVSAKSLEQVPGELEQIQGVVAKELEEQEEKKNVVHILAPWFRFNQGVLGKVNQFLKENKIQKVKQAKQALSFEMEKNKTQEFVNKFHVSFESNIRSVMEDEKLKQYLKAS